MKKVGTISTMETRKERFSHALRIFQEFDDKAADERDFVIKYRIERGKKAVKQKELAADSQDKWSTIRHKEDQQEKKEEEKKEKAALTIQRYFRGWLQRKYFKESAIIHELTGVIIGSEKLDEIMAKVVLIQALVRGWMERRRQKKMKSAVLAIETWYKSIVSQRSAEKRKAHRIFQRKKIVQEVALSEERYVESLETCLRVYVKRMVERIEDEDSPFSAHDVEMIFGNYEDFASVGRNFHTSLMERLCFNEAGELQDDEKTLISDVVSDMLGAIDDSYARYSALYLRSMRIMEEKLQDLEFAEFLESIPILMKDEGEDDISDIFSYLILPIQRIPRYELLLREILKYTSKEHWDFGGLQMAHNSAKSVAKNANRISAILQSYYRLSNLQKSTKGLARRIIGSTVTEDSIIEGNHNNMSRIFLESDVHVRSPQYGKVKTRAFLLTSEILFLKPRVDKRDGSGKNLDTEIVGGGGGGSITGDGGSGGGENQQQAGYELVAHLSLLTTKIEDDPESAVNFKIFSSNVVFLCTCKSPRDKEQWVKTALVLITRGHNLQKTRRNRTLKYKEGCGMPMPQLKSRKSYLSFNIATDVDKQNLTVKSEMNVCLTIVIPLIQLRKVMMFSTGVVVSEMIKDITEKIEVSSDNREHLANSELFYPVGGVWMDPKEKLSDYGLKPLEEVEFKPLSLDDYSSFTINIPQLALKLKKTLHPRCQVRDLFRVLIEEHPEVANQVDISGIEDFRVFAPGRKKPLALDDIISQKKGTLRIKFLIEEAKETEEGQHNFQWSYGKVSTECGVCKKKLPNFRQKKCSRCGIYSHKKCVLDADSVCTLPSTE